MANEDLVLGLIHRLRDIEAAVDEVGLASPAAGAKLHALVRAAKRARSSSRRDAFLHAVSDADGFATRLQDGAREASERGRQSSFEDLLRRGAPTTDALGIEVEGAATHLAAGDKAVVRYLRAKAAAVEGLVDVLQGHPAGPPLIMHSLLSVTFGRLLATYGGSARVLVDGNDRGRVNQQILLPVASYEISLNAPNPYTPSAHPARIQPLAVVTVSFT